MFSLSMNMMAPLILPLVLMTLSLMINLRSSMDREKLSPFECGFDPKSTARIPFSLRFFLLAVLFLVFDIEIVILLGCPMSFMTYPNSVVGLAFVMFIIILVLGLMHEWNEGSLDWA